MKGYRVFMYNMPLAPRSTESDDRENAETKEFDDRDQAIAFAKSVRKKWDCVDVYQTEPQVKIVYAHGNDRYMADKRANLSEAQKSSPQPTENDHRLARQ